MQRYSFTKMLALLLLICFCLFGMSCSVMSSTHKSVPTDKNERLVYEQEIMNVIVSGLKDNQKIIDISKFRCDYNTLVDVVSLVAFDSPLYAPYLSSYQIISWFGRYVQYVIPDYTHQNIVEDLNAKVDNIIAIMDDDMSDLDKVIWINDYICENHKYDASLESANVYRMLNTGVGTCRAYTQMFQLLADRAGLKTSFAISYPMKHVWNIVQVDGYWYNIDVTWNDRAQTYCYLSSDETMIAFHRNMNNATETIQFVRCTDQRYDRVQLSRKEKERYE